jgi:flagellar L-ring protein precursor FlgH
MKKIIFLFLIVVFASAAYSDSLWSEKSSSPYSPEKAYSKGDIVTVIILESMSAKHEAGTDTSVRDDLGIKFSNTFDRLANYIGREGSLSTQNSNRYQGTGRTQRASNVQAKVAATVTDVDENGNLVIEGTHKIEINDELQEMKIKGLVRSKDISISNTIYSYQVANAEVTIIGEGAIQEAESPGWFTRILNFLF